MRTIHVDANDVPHRVLVTGPPDGRPVLLVHGNCSSADYWRPLLRHLPDDLRVVAPDLRGYGGTRAAPVDATRGLRDFADDLRALLDQPGLFAPGARPVLVGHSLGGGVVMQMAVDAPERVAGLLLESPVSPFGFGGTRDEEGTPTSADFAGTGGGTANPEFLAALRAGDRDGTAPTSPRSVLRSAYVADPASLGPDEEVLLDSVLSTVVGDDNYPGDCVPADTWPGVGPGTRGVNNALSPRHLDLAGPLLAMTPKPPVVWVRGDADVIVSDTSLFDLAYLGQIGLVPGWPGAQACPPQPMVAQTRAVLRRYAGTGGRYDEVVLPGVGHSPHVERPVGFAELIRRLLG
jgi:pimeloyl-ACP methyl ester carboxylesterase